ncbi:hypothetical protein WDV85_14935 [Pseudokineococcus sp. 5B2Z-1]|uniref:hypothetical protein n=1 Tax=Pseudokineococcus sp. 5B2Z-1 TaxID=3132744 RepID=UPI00309718D4
MIATVCVVVAVLLVALLALTPVLARGVPADVVAPPHAGRGGAPLVHRTELAGRRAADDLAGAPTPAADHADAHDLAA